MCKRKTQKNNLSLLFIIDCLFVLFSVFLFFCSFSNENFISLCLSIVSPILKFQNFLTHTFSKCFSLTLFSNKTEQKIKIKT